jgi:hypothetical protein
MPGITRRRTAKMLPALFEALMPVREGMQTREALCLWERRLTLSEMPVAISTVSVSDFDSSLKRPNSNSVGDS